MTLLEVNNISKTFVTTRTVFGTPKRRVKAVSDVSFNLEAGETLALVGESGAGKSTTGRMVLRLIEPDAGTVRFDGVDVRAQNRKELRTMRQQMQMIFQDPFSSLDPRVPIGESVGEPLLIHYGTGRAERSEKAVELLERVGIGSQALDRYPSELSGGQLQRVAIARALTLKPKMIVCDEPVAALDMSVRAQVLNLMKDLQDEFGLAYLFITHDLSLVEVIADRIVVMSEGAIVETGPVAEIFKNPTDPYTQRLLSAIPVPLPRSMRTGANGTAAALVD
jgi:oligopeptide transport system ATP-binding protein